MFKKISSYIALHAAFVSALMPSWGWASQIEVHNICDIARPSAIIVRNPLDRDASLCFVTRVPADASVVGSDAKIQEGPHYFLRLKKEDSAFPLHGEMTLYNAVNKSGNREGLQLYPMMSGSVAFVYKSYFC